MEMKELQSKNPADLQKLLAQYREDLREMRFKDSNRQLKNVREIRKVKAIVARILTILNSQA
ncbi:MAG: 50S ribosomal protein L29 [Patescibacteria group bacterium]|jgi:ribosomal protein L29|nr:50S ribosomal protein L29 [Patescibacteria group bacterium]